MNLSKEQEDKFKKLNISSFIELSLLVPSTYEDYRINSSLVEHSSQVIDATVESVYRAPNSIQVTFYAHNFGHTIQGVLFRPKPYMMHQFQVGQRDYFYGLCDCKMGKCSITMPKKITQVGSITPKYKSKLRSDVLQRFIQKNLNLDTLLSEGLKEDVAKEILKLHFPESLPGKEFDSKILEALKYTELFSYMKQLSGKRRYFKAISSTINDYKNWSKSLPFELTDKQIEAIEDIKLDFSKDIAAKRMIVGDVGSGKTMVILASAYMNYPNKSILMSPTTILANQLYSEAKKFLPELKITLVTNKSKKRT